MLNFALFILHSFVYRVTCWYDFNSNHVIELYLLKNYLKFTLNKIIPWALSCYLFLFNDTFESFVCDN